MERSASVYPQITCFAYPAYRAVDITHRDGFNGTPVKTNAVLMRRVPRDVLHSAFKHDFAPKTVRAFYASRCGVDQK